MGMPVEEVIPSRIIAWTCYQLRENRIVRSGLKTLEAIWCWWNSRCSVAARIVKKWWYWSPSGLRRCCISLGETCGTCRIQPPNARSGKRWVLAALVVLLFSILCCWSVTGLDGGRIIRVFYRQYYNIWNKTIRRPLAVTFQPVVIWLLMAFVWQSSVGLSRLTWYKKSEVLLRRRGIKETRKRNGKDEN